MENQQLTYRVCGQSFAFSEELDRHNERAHGPMASGHGANKGSVAQADYQSGGLGPNRDSMGQDTKDQSGQSHGQAGRDKNDADAPRDYRGGNDNRGNPNLRDEASGSNKAYGGKSPKKSSNKDERE